MRNRSEHDPRMIREWSENDPNISDHDPTTHETVSHPSHRRGRSSRFGDRLCMEKHRISCICYLSKTHFVRDCLQNSIGNSSTSTTCNAIYSEGSILQLQITMQFHRQLIRQHHLQSHLHCGNNPAVANHNGFLSTTHARKTLDTPFTMRNRSENDPRMIRTYPNMIRPHTRPSRNRRTAEVDHRGSGTDFVWKNIGFRASAICQKRISCETSSKTLSATPPPAPLAMLFTLREASYSWKSQWNSIDNSSGSTTCNPIYIAGTILQLQITMEFCRPHMHEKHLTPHLQCGTDPRMIRTYPPMIRPHTRPSRNRRTAEVDHRGSETDFVWKNIGFRASAISQKRISCETSSKTLSATPPPAPLAMLFTLREASYSWKSQWNSIDNSSGSTTCNPIYIAGTILQLQITMEFCRPHMHEKHLTPHLQCGTDPRMIRTYPPMIRPHTRPSRNRRTAEVDHRGSETDFVWKNIGFRASAISQKRISCETSSKTPSATPPPAQLAMPFTVREQSYCFFD